MVTLLVGEKETAFNVHMDLLCKASPFFQLAFMGAGNFKDASTKSMKLAEDDPATIDRLIQWIYFGCYPVDSEIKTESSEQLLEVLNASLMQFATLYVAADKYGIIILKNNVLDRLFDLANQRKVDVTSDRTLIGYIYGNTMAGSKLRELLVEWHVWLVPYYSKACWTAKDVRDHVDFAADVLTRFITRGSGDKSPFTSDGSYKFHEKLEEEVSDSSSGSSDEELEDEVSDSSSSDS